MPSKFSKVPKLDSSKTACSDAIEDDGRISPVIINSGPFSPYIQDFISSASSLKVAEEEKDNSPGVEVTSTDTTNEVFDVRTLQHENEIRRETTNFLVYTEGSGIVAFRPHPSEE